MPTTTIDQTGSLCRLTGLLGEIRQWDKDSVRTLRLVLLLTGDEPLIRVAGAVGHPELILTERTAGKVDSSTLTDALVGEYVPVGILKICARMLLDTNALPDGLEHFKWASTL